MILLLLVACAGSPSESGPAGPFAVVLGVAQDAGRPQAGCTKTCCKKAFSDPAAVRRPSSLGIVDPEAHRYWLIDATPALPSQLHDLAEAAGPDATFGGVLLTHAHMGHYAGLLNVGREAMGGDHVPVWALPRMEALLRENAPWELLIRGGYVEVRPLEPGVAVQLSENIRVTPILVQHRDEYSETAGYRIEGPAHSALWLPDIDSWDAFDLDGTLASVDRAWVDGTFWADGELGGRDMSAVPHPRISATVDRLGDQAGKVHFVHLNHTNPALDEGEERKKIEGSGAAVGREGERFGL